MASKARGFTILTMLEINLIRPTEFCEMGQVEAWPPEKHFQSEGSKTNLNQFHHRHKKFIRMPLKIHTL
jgi:hypothetical protein